MSINTIIYPYHWDVIGTDTISLSPPDKKYLLYRKKWEENPTNKTVSEFPLHLDIEVSGRCNLMCTHCTRHSRRTKIGDMSISVFKRIIDEGIEYGLPSITPHWLGESFLHPQLVEMIYYAKKKGIIDIRINTNCSLLDEETSKRILDSGLDTIICSVDAVTKETYNRIKIGSDYDQVHKNINQIIDLKEQKGIKNPTIIVQMIDMKQNHDELTSFIDYWRVRVNKVRVATYQSPDGSPNDANRARNAPDIFFPCSHLWQRLVVAWDGTVYSCIGDNACRSPIGDIHHNSLHELWHGEKMSYLRSQHKKLEISDIETCSHCDLNKIPNSVKLYEKDLKQ